MTRSKLAISATIAGILLALFYTTWRLRRVLAESLDLPAVLSIVENQTAVLFVLLTLLVLGILGLLMPSKVHEYKPSHDLEAKIYDLELRQRLLLDEAGEVICVLDIESRFLWVSKSCRTAWGYTSEDLVGKPVLSIMEVTETSGILSAIVGAPKSIDRIAFEADLKTKGGERISVSLTGHWSATESGLFCIVHDITRQKRAEEAARQSEQKMRELLEAQQELDRIKREFVAMVTHDLRSPLTSVEGLLTLLERGALGSVNEEGQRIASGVRKECQRLLRLLNDMLQIDRMESEEFELEIAALDLAATIRDAIVNQQAAANEKEINLEFAGKPATCVGDEHRIMQVLINLLSNAIKYAPQASSIYIALEERPDDLFVSVQDSGPGIPEDKLPKIFDKFATANSMDIKRRGGTGLGLAICKGIVTQHGGEMGVESQPGRGARFWFTLPKTFQPSQHTEDPVA